MAWTRHNLSQRSRRTTVIKTCRRKGTRSRLMQLFRIWIRQVPSEKKRVIELLLIKIVLGWNPTVTFTINLFLLAKQVVLWAWKSSEWTKVGSVIVANCYPLTINLMTVETERPVLWYNKGLRWEAQVTSFRRVQNGTMTWFIIIWVELSKGKDQEN